jgi:hypothetical protein
MRFPASGRIARMPVVRVIEPPSRAILRHPGNQDLSHRLAAEAKLVVGVRQLGERLECCVAGARDHRIDAAGLLEHGSDRGEVVQIDFEIAARDAGRTSWFLRESARTTSLPMVPVAPTTMIRMTVPFDASGFSDELSAPSARSRACGRAWGRETHRRFRANRPEAAISLAGRATTHPTRDHRILSWPAALLGEP